MSNSSKNARSRVQPVDPRVGQVAEGEKLPFFGEEEIKPEKLKTFLFESWNQKINIQTAEFSAVCPFSGLPDVAKVEINYFPRTGKALELKALKYYFMSFRNVGIYQEGVTARIYKDLKEILGHSDIEVKTVYNTRGGLDVTCTEGGLTDKSVK